jgi:hypothetical protein
MRENGKRCAEMGYFGFKSYGKPGKLSRENPKRKPPIPAFLSQWDISDKLWRS